MKRLIGTLILTTAMGALAAPLAAQSQGDWTFGLGLGWVDPTSNNGTVGGAALTIDEDIRPTFTVEYFFRDNLGVELLAATPFEHTISLGGAAIATTKHLPPTLSVNYHFPTNTSFKPFVGIGVNYTTFFEESTALGNLELEDSWGIALHAGTDYQISDNGSLRFDIRWIDINTEATLNGAPLADVKIDPLVVGIAYVHRF